MVMINAEENARKKAYDAHKQYLEQCKAYIKAIHEGDTATAQEIWKNINLDECRSGNHNYELIGSRELRLTDVRESILGDITPHIMSTEVRVVKENIHVCNDCGKIDYQEVSRERTLDTIGNIIEMKRFYPRYSNILVGHWVEQLCTQIETKDYLDSDIKIPKNMDSHQISILIHSG
jgi:hypothetical protein